MYFVLQTIDRNGKDCRFRVVRMFIYIGY